MDVPELLKHHMEDDEYVFIKGLDVKAAQLREVKAAIHMIADACVKARVCKQSEAIRYVAVAFRDFNEYLHSIWAPGKDELDEDTVFEIYRDLLYDKGDADVS